MVKHLRQAGMAAVIVAGLVTVNSCKKDDNSRGCGATNISAHGKNDSHNAGQNCMSCHHDGGGGKGCFTVAGSVFNESGNSVRPNGTVKLYTGENGSGDLRATIEVDAKGNFHTTSGVDFSGGLYPVIMNEGGTAKHMSDAISTGACNSCHGQSTDHLWVQ